MGRWARCVQVEIVRRFGAQAALSMSAWGMLACCVTGCCIREPALRRAAGNRSYRQGVASVGSSARLTVLCCYQAVPRRWGGALLFIARLRGRALGMLCLCCAH